MQVKLVEFNGIERVNQKTICNEGSCEEIINLRPEGNKWEQVKSKALIDQVVFNDKEQWEDYQVYIHQVSKEQFYIFYIKYDNYWKVIAKSRTTSTIITLMQMDNELNDNFKSISSLNNVLVVCSDKVKKYFLYRNKDYDGIELDNVIGKLAVGIKDSGGSLGYSEGDIWLNMVRVYHNNRNIWGCVYRRPFTQDNDTQKLSVLKTSEALANKVALRNNVYYGLSFFRAAIKLFDGSYINFSDIVFADTTGDNSFNLGQLYSNPQFQISKSGDFWFSVFGLSLGRFDVKFSISDSNNLNYLFENKIIQSIDIFMTAPKPQWEITDNITDYRRIGDSFSPRKNKQLLKNILTTGGFNLIKSIEWSDIKDDNGTLLNQVEFEVLAEDLENLVTNPPMSTDNGREMILFGGTYNYNRTQHLFDVIYKMFEGYDNVFSLPSTEKYTHFDNNPDPALRWQAVCRHIGYDDSTPVRMFVEITDNNNTGESFCIRREIIDTVISQKSRFFFVDDGQMVFMLPRFLCYPSLGNLTLNVFLDDGQTKKIIYSNRYEQNLLQAYSFICKRDKTAANTHFESFVIWGFSNMWVPSSYRVEYSEEVTESLLEPNKVLLEQNSKDSLPDNNNIEQSYIKKTNLLRLSEQDNPFAYPAKNAYYFNEITNKIITVSASIDNLQGNSLFGTLPLYVFTTDGIFMLNVGEGDIAYNRQIPISNKAITNPKVLNIGQSIMFVANDGLNIISQSQTQLISEKVKGNPDSTAILDKLNEYYDLNTLGVLGIKRVHLSQQDILEQLLTAEFIYDGQKNEALIICDNYMYVYNTKFGNFYKRSDTYKYVNQNTLCNKQNDIITFYSSKDSEVGLMPVMIITKPFNLSTNQYKKIERLILSSHYDTGDPLELWLLGTNDNIKYSIAKHVKRQDVMVGDVINVRELQDLRLSRCFVSYRYFVLVIAAKRVTNIANVLFQFNEVHKYGGIR